MYGSRQAGPGSRGHRSVAAQCPSGPVELSSRLLPALDSLLKLSHLLAENPGERLSPRQVDYAQTIYSIAAELQLAVDRLRERGEADLDSGAA